ncbi:hypothetical protein MWN52_02835 [Pseudoxanthomonas winnipegensis]|uniref:hypothetical protein n=1 Tax=Pseudoxanthomonas winnipegensis TaxID=2480810 RepID=UPI002574FF96|nr:hypothetical protein [Pseudoxanthomonas winnipegensis]WJI16259.1 hypothetical protein MWN52_02835 [Pseudoxanthomonas winnipegensis]
MKKNNTRISLMIAAAAMLAASCSKIEERPAEGADAAKPAATATPAAPSAPSNIDETPVLLDARVEIPSGWSKDAIKAGECMTPVDQINGAPVASAAYTAGQDVKIVGWNIISDKSNATPELVYGVLKPYDQSGQGMLLPGKRTERPDVANGNAAYKMAGYELSGKLPAAPGRYRLYVWTGTPAAITECDSKIVVVVQ